MVKWNTKQKFFDNYEKHVISFACSVNRFKPQKKVYEMHVTIRLLSAYFWANATTATIKILWLTYTTMRI